MSKYEFFTQLYKTVKVPRKVMKSWMFLYSNGPVPRHHVLEREAEKLKVILHWISAHRDYFLWIQSTLVEPASTNTYVCNSQEFWISTTYFLHQNINLIQWWQCKRYQQCIAGTVHAWHNVWNVNGCLCIGYLLSHLSCPMKISRKRDSSHMAFDAKKRMF